MLELKNTQVMNLDGAIRGMRNPLASWNKSDSQWDGNTYKLGEADLKFFEQHPNSD